MATLCTEDGCVLLTNHQGCHHDGRARWWHNGTKNGRSLAESLVDPDLWPGGEAEVDQFLADRAEDGSPGETS